MASLPGDLGASIMHGQEETEEEDHMLEGGRGGGVEEGEQGPRSPASRWQRTLLLSMGTALLLAGIVALAAPVSLHQSDGGPRVARLAQSLFLAASASDGPPGAAPGGEVFREVTMRGNEMFPNATAVDKWIDLAPKIDAIKYFINSLKGIKPRDLKAAVTEMNSKKILFDVEAGGIRRYKCDSTRLADEEFNKVKRFYQAGGRFSLWTMDGPFAHGLKTALQKSCHYETVEKAVDMIVGYCRRITDLLEQNGWPPVVFGFNEPVPWYNVGKFPSAGRRSYGDLAELIPKLAKAMKQNKLELGFFHTDHPSNYAGGGYEKLKELMKVTRAAGLRYGKYFNNDKAGNRGDKVFYESAVADRDTFVKVNGKPDNSIFESWFKYPSAGYPLDADYTLAWDVAHFFPKRSGPSPWAIELQRKLEQFDEAHGKKETG